MTDTNNTDGAALLPVTAEDRTAYCDYEDLDGKYRERVMSGAWDNVAGVQAFARHRIATQEDAERSGAEVEQAAWDWLAGKFLNIEAGYDPSDRDYSADEMVDAFIAGRTALAASPPTLQRQEYEGEAVREAARAVLADADRPGSRMLLGDDKTPDSWIEYREVGQVELDALAAALAHPAQATPSDLRHLCCLAPASGPHYSHCKHATITPSALSGDAGEGIDRVTSSISFGNLRDLVGMQRELRPGTFAYAALIDLIAALPSHQGAE